MPGVHDAVGHDPLGGVRAVAPDQNSVTRATGLSCSIGVTPNKLLSKIASELEKPDGLTVLTEADIPPASGRWACARSTALAQGAAKLGEMGIRRRQKLAAFDRACSSNALAKLRRLAARRAHGATAAVVTQRAVSISRGRRSRDLHAVRDRAMLGRILDELCERLAADLARKGYAGKTVGIKLRFEGFHTVTRDQTFPAPCRPPPRSAARRHLSLKRVDFDKRLRLLG